MPEMTLQLTVNQLHDTHRLSREWDPRSRVRRKPKENDAATMGDRMKQLLLSCSTVLFTVLSATTLRGFVYGSQQGHPEGYILLISLLCVGLIRFRGHRPKGGYDGQNGIKAGRETSATTVL